jgi:hypothetical protein
MAFHREVGLNRLVRTATGCLTQWAHDHHGMRMGIVAVIHTFGADLKWHPHGHLLVTEGGLSLDGERWVQPYKLGWLMSQTGVKKMWRYPCVTAFREAHRAGELRWEAKSAFLKKYPVFQPAPLEPLPDDLVRAHRCRPARPRCHRPLHRPLHEAGRPGGVQDHLLRREGGALLLPGLCPRRQEMPAVRRWEAPYTTHTGHAVAVDDPPRAAFIHEAFC